MNRSFINRTLCLFLAAMLVLCASACGNGANGKAKNLLPCSLTFGMTYDAFKTALSENGITAPELTEAKYNTGFTTEGLFVLSDAREPAAFDWSFMHSETLSNGWKADVSRYNDADPALYFAFNEDRALYQVVCIFDGLDAFQTETRELEAFLNGFFPADGIRTEGASVLYTSGTLSAELERDRDLDCLFYTLTDSTYNTVSEKVPEETGPSEDEIRRAVAEVIDSTPQYAEWSAVSIGRMITRVFDDYTLEVEPVGGSVYNATISGTYVPIADMPNYLLQGAITYRVDIEARTCVVVNDPDNINGILTSYVFN